MRTDIEYNPYLPELKFTADDSMLSTFNSLDALRHKRFFEWCPRIFDELYRELRCDFSVRCFSTEFIGGCLKSLANEYPFCSDLEWFPLRFDSNVYERFSEMELLGCDEEHDITLALYSLSDDSNMLGAAFDAVEEQFVFQRSDDGSLSFDDCPLINIKLKPSRQPSGSAELNVALCGGLNDIIRARSGQGASVAMIFSDRSYFVGIKNGYLVFETEPDSISDLMLDIIEELILAPLLSDMAYRYKRDNKDFLTPEENLRIELLTSMTPIVTADIPEMLFIGRRYLINSVVFPPDIPMDIRLVSGNVETVTVEGNTLVPVREGRTDIIVFIEGDPHPIKKQTVVCKDKILLSNISLFPSILYMPKDGKAHFELRAIPDNADNLDELTWSSSDVSIADIDAKTGEIQALESGNCVVSVETPECCAQAKVYVQPSLVDIEFADHEMIMHRGEKRRWEYYVIPSNAYGADMLRISSSSPSVADYRGGYIIAKNAGVCSVRITTKDGDRSWTLSVRVNP